MTTKKLKPLPKFANEEEEARWHADHREESQDYFGSPTPPADGLTPAQRLGLTPEDRTQQIALRLSVRDINRAKQVAERKGVGYQTLLKMLIREGLQRIES